MVRLPRDVENAFEEVHIQKIWNVLEDKFSFNVKGWKEEFDMISTNHDRFKDI